MDVYGLPASPHYDTAIFNGTAVTVGTSWQTWRKPIGKSMATIMVFGGGGGGGTGVIGANSTAAGGGGGGSGSQTVVDIPLDFLPSRLYVSVPVGATGVGLAAYVSTQPNTTTNHVIASANGGGVGGNASGATAGTLGTGATASGASAMALGFAFVRSSIAGNAGVAGGTTGAGTGFTTAQTGIRLTGGTGGGGLPAAATNGSDGGILTGVAASLILPTLPGGFGATSATTPAGAGADGMRVSGQIGDIFFMGGTGSGSTHGSATGAGLVQAAGGNGGIGSGGGGMGGALTGSTAAVASKGGAGFVMIVCY